MQPGSGSTGWGRGATTAGGRTAVREREARAAAARRCSRTLRSAAIVASASATVTGDSATDALPVGGPVTATPGDGSSETRPSDVALTPSRTTATG